MIFENMFDHPENNGIEKLVSLLDPEVERFIEEADSPTHAWLQAMFKSVEEPSPNTTSTQVTDEDKNDWFGYNLVTCSNNLTKETLSWNGALAAIESGVLEGFLVSL